MMPRNVAGLTFIIETLEHDGGRKLGRVRPDEDGYYCKMPLAAFGIVTRNRTFYDIPDFQKQLTGEDSFVRKMVSAGQLYGEFGHPDTTTMTNDQTISRLLMIDEKNISHHIRKIETGEKLEGGGVMIYGDIKPTGPYGRFLKENLDDPSMNTSFSLRSIAASQKKGDVIYRNMKKLVTFDAVAAGGYAEASKRFAPGVESIVANIIPGITQLTQAALESFTNHELNEIFGSKEVRIRTQTVTYIPNADFVVDENGKKRSLFHTFLGSPEE